MKRPSTALALLALACAPEPARPELEPEPPAAATGAARWEPVRRPGDEAVLEHPAEVVGDPSASGEVSAPFRARVTRVFARVGQEVVAGDPIVEVVMPEVLDAAASVRATSARIAAHRDRARELERLLAEGLVDAARVFEQRAIVAELEAERARALAVLRSASLDPGDASAALRRGTVVLRAPASGVVRSIDVTLGELREPGGEPLATILGSGEPRIEVRSSAPLPRFDAATFEAADGTRVALRAQPTARATDPREGTHLTWLVPEPPVALIDGLRGRVRIALDAPDLWEVPASALVPTERGAFVLRRDGDAFARVAVDVVTSSGASAIVRGPLREGDEVAARPGELESRGG